MAVLLGSVAAFEIAHAVVKFLLFSGSEDPCKIATDQTKGYAPCPDNDATENPTSMGYVGEVPINNFAILHKTSSMKTQTANVEPFHDAVNYFVTSSSKKVQALKKAPAKKKLKSSEKRAMAITRAKKSMAADKMKVEAIKKRKAADVRRVWSPTARNVP